MKDTHETLTAQGKIRKAAWFRLEAARLIQEAEEELKCRVHSLDKAAIIRRGQEASDLIFG